MKYKLLALDLDGTLTNTKKEITPYTRRTIIKAQQKGVKIILATGRPTYGVAPIAEHLCLREYGGYILSYNGGRIINWQIWGIERSGFFNGREKWAKGFENQRV